MNIPSNYTPEEIVKYCNLPVEAEAVVNSLVDRIIALEAEVKQLNKADEINSEQLYFRDEFIGQVLHAIQINSTYKDLVKEIKSCLDNSYIEL